MKTIYGLLDRPRQVVFQVAQPHIRLPIGTGFYLNQVLKVQHNILVAIAHKNVKVSIHHRSAIAVSCLQRSGLDAVTLVCLSLFLRVRQRVNNLYIHPPVGSQRVLGQHVSNARHKRRQQWMRLGAEITAHEQRFIQVGEQAASCGRKAVLPASSEVHAQPRHRKKPHVQDSQICANQHHRQNHALPVRQRVRTFAPALGIKCQHIQRQKYPDQRHVIKQVAQIQHTALNTLKARARPERAQ